MAAKDPRLMAVRPNGLDDMPVPTSWSTEKAEAQGEHRRQLDAARLVRAALRQPVHPLGPHKRVFIRGEPDSRTSPTT
jgi:hypothetical protein